MQGGLSRNKVAVGESAAGSPPNEIKFGQVKTDHTDISVPARNQRARSSVGRARRLQRRGLGFKSPRVHWYSKILDAPGLATEPGKGLRPRQTGAMIRCVEEMQRDTLGVSGRYMGLKKLQKDVLTPVSGWLGSGADEGRAKLR